MCGFVDRDTERGCASYAVGSLRLLPAVDKTSPQGIPEGLRYIICD